MRQVSNSLGSLLATQERITNDLPSLRALGMQLGSWGPSELTNRVQITVSGLDPTEAQTILAARYGSNVVEVVPGSLWHTASKSNDSVPWWGGIWIDGSTRTCTSGFNWVSTDGLATYIATAGHCHSSPFWNNAGNNVGSTTYVALNNTTDFQLIYNTSVQGRIYTTFNGSQPVTSYYTLQRTDSHYNVCASGRNFDEECSSRVYLTNQCLQFEDMPVTVCGMIIAQHTVASSIRGGDSGGPVYTYNSTGVAARGSITGFYAFNPTLWAYTPIDRMQQGIGGGAPLG